MTAVFAAELHVVAGPVTVQATTVSAPSSLTVNTLVSPAPGPVVSSTDKFCAVQALFDESV